MQKTDFVTGLRLYKDYMDRVEKLDDLGVSLFESPISNAIDGLFDLWIKSITDDPGADLVYWWLFKSGDKNIYDLEDTIIDNLEDEEMLYDYMNKNDYFKV